MHANGPAGPTDKNLAEQKLEREPSEFAVVNIRMVVPSKIWADHFASRYEQHAYLSHDGFQVSAEIENLHPSEWEMVRYEADSSAEQFDIGEWVAIDQFNRNGAHEFDFKKGTVGQIIGIRWGWKTPFLVAVELPFVDADGTEWLLCGEKPPYIAQYFSSYSLKRLPVDQIPEKYRDSANQRPEKPAEQEDSLSEEEKLRRRKIMDDVIDRIRSDVKEYSQGSLYRWKHLQRMKKRQEYQSSEGG